MRGLLYTVPRYVTAAVCAYMVIMCSGCPPHDVDPKPPPPYPSASCVDVCAHWRGLGCTEAEPTKQGGTCQEVCENVQESGIITWNLGCKAKVTSCEQIDSCE